MKKRLLTLLMVLALVLSLCPAALADRSGGGTARSTAFFTDNNAAKRTELTFSDIRYEDCRMDWDDFFQALDDAYAAIGGDDETVAEAFGVVYDMVEMSWTMNRFTTITGYQNYADAYAWADYYDNYTGSWEWVLATEYNEETGESGVWVWVEGEYQTDEEGNYVTDGEGNYVWIEAHSEWVPATYTDEDTGVQYSQVYYYGPYWYTWDYFYYLVHTLLTAGYRDVLAPYFPSSDPTDYRCLEYYESEYEPYDYDYDVNSELLSDYESYSYYKDYYTDEKFQALVGGTYLAMVENWNSLAGSMDYDSYLDYVYAYYGRDYTPADIQAFEAAVKEYLVPVYLALGERNGDLDLYSGAFAADYTSDEALASIRPYLADMSSELLASFDYMVEHGMYDLQSSETKYYGGAYTDWFYSFGTPFLFSDPYTEGYYNIINFSTIVHEFGHYNAMYYDPMGFLELTKADDIMETHSQGLELLMTHYYPQLFGEDAGDVTDYFMEYFLGTLVWQCLRDEFEQYAFSEEELTVEKLNRKYYQLEVEYGIIAQEDAAADGQDASWMDIAHFFSYPCYLISYATSLSGAFSFWLEAQDNFYAAVDDYLAFCALDMELGFEESFAEVGVANPISPSYVKELAAALTKALLTEEPEPEPDDEPYVPVYPSKPNSSHTSSSESGNAGTPSLFSDVPANAWYRDAVDYVAELGLMEGVGGGKFSPDTGVTRGQLVTILYRLEGEPDVSGTSAFADVASGAWYADAVAWAAGEGIVIGYNSRFGPTDTVSRQDMLLIFYRYAQYKGYDVSVGEDTNILSYTDAERISGYAVSAMQWACGSGVLVDSGNGVLCPRDSVERSELAVTLMRFIEG